MPEETHEFTDDGAGNCTYAVDDIKLCGLPERAGVHITIVTVPGKEITFTYNESGIVVGITGMFDAAEYALLSIVTADMARQALAAGAQVGNLRNQLKDHRGKGGVVRN